MPPNRSARGRGRAPPPQPAMFRLHAPQSARDAPPVEDGWNKEEANAHAAEAALASGAPGARPDAHAEPDAKPSDGDGRKRKSPAQESEPAAKEPPQPRAPEADIQDGSEKDSIAGEIKRESPPRLAAPTPHKPPRGALKAAPDNDAPKVAHYLKAAPPDRESPAVTPSKNSQSDDCPLDSDSSDDDEPKCKYPTTAVKRPRSTAAAEVYARNMREKEENARSRRGKAAEAEEGEENESVAEVEGKSAGKNGWAKSGEDEHKNESAKNENSEGDVDMEEIMADSKTQAKNDRGRVRVKHTPRVPVDVPRNLVRGRSTRAAEGGANETLSSTSKGMGSSGSKFQRTTVDPLTRGKSSHGGNKKDAREASPPLEKTQKGSFGSKFPPEGTAAASKPPKDAAKPVVLVASDAQGRLQLVPPRGAQPRQSEAQASSLKYPTEGTQRPPLSCLRRSKRGRNSPARDNTGILKSPPEVIESRPPDENDVGLATGILLRPPVGNANLKSEEIEFAALDETNTVASLKSPEDIKDTGKEGAKGSEEKTTAARELCSSKAESCCQRRTRRQAALPTTEEAGILKHLPEDGSFITTDGKNKNAVALKSPPEEMIISNAKDASEKLPTEKPGGETKEKTTTYIKHDRLIMTPRRRSKRKASTMAEELASNLAEVVAAGRSKRKRNANEGNKDVGEEEIRRSRRTHKPSLKAKENMRNEEETEALEEAKRSGRSAAATKRGKPSKSFRLGDRVEAKYHGKGKRYYPGEIVRVHPREDRYDVDYVDGDIDRGLSAVFIRLLLGPIELVEVEVSGDEEQEQEESEGEDEKVEEEGVSEAEVVSVASESSYESDRKPAAKKRRRHSRRVYHTAKGVAMWKERFALLRAYHAKHGTCDIIHAYSMDPLLKNFVSEQRKQYKRFQSGEPSSLTEERIAELEELGFDFCPLQSGKTRVNHDLRNQKRWDAQFAKLEEYKAENGDCLVSGTTGNHKKLGNWVRGQRKHYNKVGREGFNPERLTRLEQIGFDFDPVHSGSWSAKKRAVMLPRIKAIWEKHYKDLLKFKEEHGNIIVGPNAEGYPGLYDWIHCQRKHYKRYMKGDEKAVMFDTWIAKMDEIGFDWAPMKGGGFSKMLLVRYIKHYCDLWEKNYINLQKFKEKHGHCYVSRVGEYASLGGWIHVQRKNRRKLDQGKLTSLTEERIKLMDNIGFDWYPSQSGGRAKLAQSNHDGEWDAVFERMCLYKKEHGHANPKKKVKRLGPWASRMRSLYAKKARGESTNLTDAKIAKLDSIGFKFVAEK